MRATPATAAPDLGLVRLAAALARELAELGALATEIELALSLCHFAEHTDAAAIRGLQGLDRITQTLADLARLLAALPDQLPASWQVASPPLLGQLRLHELAQRLGQTDPPAAPAPVGSPGEVFWL